MSAKAKKEAPAAEAPAVKASVADRKINPDELISLQKEGRLTSYNPDTGMGTVKSVGSDIIWPVA